MITSALREATSTRLISPAKLMRSASECEEFVQFRVSWHVGCVVPRVKDA